MRNQIHLIKQGKNKKHPYDQGHVCFLQMILQSQLNFKSYNAPTASPRSIFHNPRLFKELFQIAAEVVFLVYSYFGTSPDEPVMIVSHFNF